VQSPADYQWSGHNAYLGKIKTDWLSTDWVLRQFSRKKREARKEYRQFVTRGIGEAYRKEFHTGNMGGIALGDEEFVMSFPELAKLSHKPEKPPMALAEFSKKVCDFFEIPESLLKDTKQIRSASKIRSIIALEFTRYSGTIRQVADYFGRDLSTLSRQLTNLKRNVSTDAHLQKEIQALKEYLRQ
jgi:hypothetical protein